MRSTVISMINPKTGEAIEPIGHRANGAPIFPLMGGSGDDDDDTDGDDTDGTDGSDDGDDADGDADGNDDTDGDDTDGDGDGDDSDNGSKPWDEKRARADAKKLRNENKNLRARANQDKADAEAWRAHKKSQLSKEDQLKADLDEKENNTKGLARENALLKVQIETGLSERQVKRLSGDDYESLLEDAKEFIEDNPGALTPKKDAPPRKTPPAKNLKGGSKGDQDDDAEIDPAKLAARVPRNY